MDLFRILVVSLMLVYSGQSLALFMPEGFKISTETTSVPDEGCGVMGTPSRDQLAS